MGEYNMLMNNCQDFCQRLAKELGCTGTITSGSDVAKTVAIGAAGVGLFGIGIAALYKAFSKPSDDEKNK